MPSETFDVPFTIVAPTVFGPMILHRLDPGQGLPAIRSGRPIAMEEISLVKRALALLGPAPVFLDIGSNVGFFTMALARAVGPRGKVYCFEGQRIIFNMLAGSVALNGLLNVICMNACVGRSTGRIEIPAFDYRRAMSFGSVEFGAEQKETLAQQRGAARDPDTVPMTTIDTLALPKVSLMKIDVEGMELDVLAGAQATIRRDMPIVFAEYLKSGKAPLQGALEALGYEVQDVGGYNLLAAPRDGTPSGAALLAEILRPPELPAGFDAETYLRLNPDVRAAGADAVGHYLHHGWKECRDYQD